MPEIFFSRCLQSTPQIFSRIHEDCCEKNRNFVMAKTGGFLVKTPAKPGEELFFRSGF